MKRIIKNSNENLSFTKILSFIQNIKSILKVNPIIKIYLVIFISNIAVNNSFAANNVPAKVCDPEFSTNIYTKDGETAGLTIGATKGSISLFLYSDPTITKWCDCHSAFSVSGEYRICFIGKEGYFSFIEASAERTSAVYKNRRDSVAMRSWINEWRYDTNGVDTIKRITGQSRAYFAGKKYLVYSESITIIEK